MSDLQTFIETLFRPGEATCFAALKKGTSTFPVDEPPGWVQFFSLNPLHLDFDFDGKAAPGKGRRADVNVTAYRNFLVEIDGMPLGAQTEYIASLEVPWSTCVYSGGKSFHFIISLEEDVGTAAYAHLAKRILLAVMHADQSTKNPSRLSRFPDVTRKDNGVVQELIEVRPRISRETLETWLERFPKTKIKEATTEFVASLEDLEPNQRGLLWPTTYTFLREEAPPGFRNRYLFMAACDFHEQGYPLEEALARLAKASSLGLEEFTETVQSAYQRPPKYGVRTWGLRCIQKVSG